MLRVRNPPDPQQPSRLALQSGRYGPLHTRRTGFHDTSSSRSSLECSRPCQGRDRGFKSPRGRCKRRAAFGHGGGTADVCKVCNELLDGVGTTGSCSPRRPVKPLSLNKRGGRRKVQSLHDPLPARSSIGSGRQPLKLQGRVQFPHGSHPLARWPSGETGRRTTLRTSRRIGMGVRISPWPLGMQTGKCPIGPHKAGAPGSIPGSAIGCRQLCIGQEASLRRLAGAR